MNLNEYAYLFGMLIVILFLSIGTIKYSRKLNRLINNNKSEAKNYSREITIGIVSALVLLILDRTITGFANNSSNLHLDTSSIINFIYSITGTILILITEVLFIVFSITWIIYLGFPKK